MPRKSEPEKEYVKGSFILSFEHIQLASLVGGTENSLIEEKLVNLEVDLVLTPNSLMIYHTEARSDYYQYFYTERTNMKFVRDFLYKMRGGNLMINPMLN